MGHTIMGAVVSLDGFIADIGGDVGTLFDWYGNGDVELEDTNARDREVRWLAGQARAPPPRSGAENSIMDDLEVVRRWKLRYTRG